MHIHYLKHVPFEGLGSMENYFVSKGHKISNTSFYLNQSLPPVDELDVLVVMGGPMSVNEEARYPWLRREKDFIYSALKREVPVLGVCLGAQLIAAVLGASVVKNAYEEIGWYPVRLTRGIVADEQARHLPDSFDALHWHGETFSIPSGARNFISSEGCANQAFVYGDNVLGLQFHLEMLPSHVEAIYRECGRPALTGTYIQGEDEMLAPVEKFRNAQNILEEFLRTFIFQNLSI